MNVKKLNESYYLRPDVVALAADLLGKVLCSCFEGKLTSGIITETEAYQGISDRASHAYGGKMTSRNRIMFAKGSTAYIYLCYGIHSLFNVVTNKENVPDAVLIRGIYPLDGIQWMEQRLGRQQSIKKMGNGPGKVSALLGFHYSMSGTSLLGDSIWLEDRNYKIPATLVRTGPRIGVAYAGEDALLPYRFYIDDPEAIVRQIK